MGSNPWVLVLFLFARPTPAAQPRAYVNETTLATKLETQVELVASPTSFSLPPLSSKWGAAVFDSLIGGEASRSPAAQALRAALRAPLTSFGILERGGNDDIVTKSRTAQDALELLLVGLDARGGGRSVLASIAAKGAIAKWNELVGAVVNRWEALSRRAQAIPPELTALESFLNSANAREIQNALKAFRPH